MDFKLEVVSAAERWDFVEVELKSSRSAGQKM